MRPETGFMLGCAWTLVLVGGFMLITAFHLSILWYPIFLFVYAPVTLGLAAWIQDVHP